MMSMLIDLLFRSFNVDERLTTAIGLNVVYGNALHVIPLVFRSFSADELLTRRIAVHAVYGNLLLLIRLFCRGINTEKLGTFITLGSGIVAGTTASLISQPGDTVLSVMSKAPGLSVSF